MTASPASKALRSKPLAGAITATRSWGRSAGGAWKILLMDAPRTLGTPAKQRQSCSLRWPESVRERFEFAPQRGAPALELIEPLRGLAQPVEILHRCLLYAAVGVACRHPQALHADIAGRHLAAQSDEGKRGARAAGRQRAAFRRVTRPALPSGCAS